MTALDDRLRATAKRLIEAAGKRMTLTARGVSVYDPATGLVTTPESSTNVTGVLDDVELGRDDGYVQRGDRIVLIAAASLPAAPTPGDRLTIDATSHAVISVEASYSGELPTLYRLQVRR